MKDYTCRKKGWLPPGFDTAHIILVPFLFFRQANHVSDEDTWLYDLAVSFKCSNLAGPTRIGGWLLLIYGRVTKFGTSKQARPKTASPTLLSSFSPHQAIVPNFLIRPLTGGWLFLIYGRVKKFGTMAWWGEKEEKRVGLAVLGQPCLLVPNFMTRP